MSELDHLFGVYTCAYDRALDAHAYDLITYAHVRDIKKRKKGFHFKGFLQVARGGQRGARLQQNYAKYQIN